MSSAGQKRVAVVEDLDDLLSQFDNHIKGHTLMADIAARQYAETDDKGRREEYLHYRRSVEDATRLRESVTKRVRVLLPGEIDRLEGKGA